MTSPWQCCTNTMWKIGSETFFFLDVLCPVRLLISFKDDGSGCKMNYFLNREKSHETGIMPPNCLLEYIMEQIL